MFLVDRDIVDCLTVILVDGWLLNRYASGFWLINRYSS